MKDILSQAYFTNCWGAADKTIYNTPQHVSIPLYLRIANELYLKRLIVGGKGVYEFKILEMKDGQNTQPRIHNARVLCRL